MWSNGNLNLNYQAPALLIQTFFSSSPPSVALLPLSRDMQATIHATGNKLNNIRYLSSLSCQQWLVVIYINILLESLWSRNCFRDWKSNAWHGNIHVKYFCSYTVRWMHISFATRTANQRHWTSANIYLVTTHWSRSINDKFWSIWTLTIALNWPSASSEHERMQLVQSNSRYL